MRSENSRSWKDCCCSMVENATEEIPLLFCLISTRMRCISHRCCISDSVQGKILKLFKNNLIFLLFSFETILVSLVLIFTISIFSKCSTRCSPLSQLLPMQCLTRIFPPKSLWSALICIKLAWMVRSWTARSYYFGFSKGSSMQHWST